MKILRSCSPLMTVLVPGTTLTMSALRAEGGIKFRGNCSGNGSTIEKKNIVRTAQTRLKSLLVPYAAL